MIYIYHVHTETLNALETHSLCLALWHYFFFSSPNGLEAHCLCLLEASLGVQDLGGVDDGCC